MLIFMLIFCRVTKEEARQDEIISSSANISNTFSVQNETVYTAITTEAPELSFLDRMMSTIGLRSLQDEDRMIGKLFSFCFDLYRQ